jgi:hypothetical protein
MKLQAVTCRSYFPETGSKANKLCHSTTNFAKLCKVRQTSQTSALYRMLTNKFREELNSIYVDANKQQGKKEKVKANIIDGF